MSPQTHRFEGKAALITGASRGIGFAIAQRIVAEGGRVCITARRIEALRNAVRELGGDAVATAVAGSADNPEHQDEAVDACLHAFGRLDVLVNNTGINPVYGPLLEVGASTARKILEVNLLAALEWTKKTYAAALAHSGGAIVNLASVAGLAPAEGLGFYGSTKAAVMHLTQQLACELGPQVRVNAIAPAVVRTQFASVLYEGNEPAVTERYALKRLGEPSDVAAAAAFLASQDAAWITGQTLIVDGGLTLGGGI